MENASKALLMAAEILIAVLIASMFVLLFSTMSEYSKEYESKKQTEAIQAFNAKFLQYTQNATAQDVLTVINMAESYNKNNGYTESDTAYYISIEINGVDKADLLNGVKTSIEDKDDVNTDNIQDNLNLYSAQKITYSDVTGKINKIVYQKNS